MAERTSSAISERDDPGAERIAAAAPDREAGVALLEHAHHLLPQAGLAHPRRARDEHHLSSGLVDGVPEEVLDAGELPLAADERRLLTEHRTRAGRQLVEPMEADSSSVLIT